MGGGGLLLGAALILAGSAVMYYAVTGQDPRLLITATAGKVPKLGGGKGGKSKPSPARASL